MAIYQAGKASGHVEVLEDPDGMAKTLVKEVIVSQHAVDSGSEKRPGWHKRSSPLHRRVSQLGETVLHAARAEVAALLDALPPKATGEPQSVTAQREALEEAAGRLRGTWHFVVTTSDAINAFVTPYCPRRVFVTEGLLHKLKLTNDELAFILSHELSHVVHGHGRQSIDEQATLASLQLVVLSLIDPTGLLALAISAVASFALTAQGRAHSRVHESEADELGLAICSRACYEQAGSTSAMAKLQRAAGNQAKAHAGWLDTHPAEADRIAALEQQVASGVDPVITSACASKKGGYWRAMRFKPTATKGKPEAEEGAEEVEQG